MVEFDVASGLAIGHDRGRAGPPLAAFLAEVVEVVPPQPLFPIGLLVAWKIEGVYGHHPAVRQDLEVKSRERKVGSRGSAAPDRGSIHLISVEAQVPQARLVTVAVVRGSTRIHTAS